MILILNSTIACTMPTPPHRLLASPSERRELGPLDTEIPVLNAPPIYERFSTSHTTRIRHTIPEKPCPAIKRTLRLPRLIEYGKKLERINVHVGRLPPKPRPLH